MYHYKSNTTCSVLSYFSLNFYEFSMLNSVINTKSSPPLQQKK